MVELIHLVSPCGVEGFPSATKAAVISLTGMGADIIVTGLLGRANFHRSRFDAEENVSTESGTSGQNPWVSVSNGHPCGTTSFETPPRQGPEAADSIASKAMQAPRSRESFPKKIRLVERRDFQRVYRNGRRERAAHFTVFFDCNQLSFSRFGITVSKKLGSAVIRNRLRRIFREAIRKNRGLAIPGFDFVFNPHTAATTIKTPALSQELVAVFSQVKKRYDAPSPLERA
jgi:ribonuclease P protein component